MSRTVAGGPSGLRRWAAVAATMVECLKLEQADQYTPPPKRILNSAKAFFSEVIRGADWNRNPSGLTDGVSGRSLIASMDNLSAAMNVVSWLNSSSEPSVLEKVEKAARQHLECLEAIEKKEQVADDKLLALRTFFEEFDRQADQERHNGYSGVEERLSLSMVGQGFVRRPT